MNSLMCVCNSLPLQKFIASFQLTFDVNEFAVCFSDTFLGLLLCGKFEEKLAAVVVLLLNQKSSALQIFQIHQFKNINLPCKTNLYWWR